MKDEKGGKILGTISTTILIAALLSIGVVFGNRFSEEQYRRPTVCDEAVEQCIRTQRESSLGEINLILATAQRSRTEHGEENRLCVAELKLPSLVDCVKEIKSACDVQAAGKKE